MRIAVPLLLALAAPAFAQQPPAPPREPPSNMQTGISIDRFIGDAARSPARVSHDVMFTRSILREGDPQRPGDTGAVLTINKEVLLATLPARNTTPLTRMPEQLTIYVKKGTGRVDDGRQYWELKPGIALLIPPNGQHRFTATGDGDVEMIIMSRTLEPEVTPRKDILVRDVDALALTERNVHWSNMAKYVFLGEDGLYPTDHLYIVYMNPMTIAGPHAHTADQEEIWIKITDAPALMQLGSEIREWPVNAGFRAPPNGQTVHAAINHSDQMQAWFYLSRLAPAPAPGTAPRPSRPPNPAIVEGLERATIAGRPLAGLRER